MRRGIFLLILLFSHAVLYAQADEAVSKGENIRKRMLAAFGGEKNINKVKAIEYTVIDNSFHNGAPFSTRTIYLLDLQRRHVTTTSHSRGESVVRAIDDEGAWKLAEGLKEPLSHEEQEQLEQILCFNLLSMLQKTDLQYEYLHECHYKGYTADVVRVTDPSTSKYINLFVAKENAIVLASTLQGKERQNEPVSYRDELEYKRLNKGITLPQAYQLFVNGELASEGRVVDIRLIEKKR